MEEAKIPVFSVLKKGSTLKNIFLNSPPHENRKSLSTSDKDPIRMGRHPDCDIVVDHPSISRFHLEIHTNSSLQKLFVTDCSSVHGTWVSGEKIQADIPIELIEGDTFMLGASTRIYRLHWMPLSIAFEMEKPMSPLMEEALDFIDNDEFLQDKNLNDVWVCNSIPSAPPMLASSPGSIFSQDSEKEGQILIRKENSEQTSCFSSIVPLLESVSSSWPSEEDIGASKNFLVSEMQPQREEPIQLSSDKVAKSSSLLLRRNKSINFLEIENICKENESNKKGKEDFKIGEVMVGTFVGVKEDQDNPFVLLAEGDVRQEEEEVFVSDKDSEKEGQILIRKENLEHTSCFSSIVPLIESVSSSSPSKEDIGASKNFFFSEMQPQREEPIQLSSDKVAKSSSLLLRRNKSINFLEIENICKENESNKKGKEDFKIGEVMVGTFVGVKEDQDNPFVLLAEGDVRQEEEEVFVSDKENMTPVNSIGSKVLRSNRKIDRSLLSSFSLFHKEDLETQEKNVEVISSVFSAEGDMKVEEEEEISVLDEVKMSLTKFTDSKLLKSNREMNRSLLGSFNISNKDDLEVEEHEVGIFVGVEKIPVFLGEGHVEEEEETNSIGSKVLSKNIETSPQSSLNTFNLEEELSCSDKPTSEAIQKFKSNKHRSRSRLVKENEDPKLYDTKYLESPFSPGRKLQRSLFKSEGTPLNEKKALNVEDRVLSDNENQTPNIPKSMKSGKAFAKDFLKADNEDNETFVSDKENWTPELSMSIKSKNAISQNHGKKGETLSGRKERIPFQPLFVSSPLRNSSPACYVEELGASFSNNCVNSVHNLDDKAPDIKHKEELPHVPGRENKKWYIVVDVGCFLTEESRKSIQLLEGIRGTQLIIPRIVIRELDYLKRCQGILSRGTKASSVLQWIEDCMMKSGWWIHVQSSSETFPVAATPPATPRSQLCDGSSVFGAAAPSNFNGFSTCGSLMEIVSPTAEDHILDCALLFKRMKDDGQLMLLTSSTTLRIKSLAEGLLCETPKEFRESLVNPLSKRFLWADSSPRGSTWSCLEELSVPENCHQQIASARVTKAEGTKGLKLILLHGSRYGVTNLIS